MRFLKSDGFSDSQRPLKSRVNRLLSFIGLRAAGVSRRSRRYTALRFPTVTVWSVIHVRALTFVGRAGKKDSVYSPTHELCYFVPTLKPLTASIRLPPRESALKCEERLDASFRTGKIRDSGGATMSGGRSRRRIQSPNVVTRGNSWPKRGNSWPKRAAGSPA